ncbi:MAG TPA: glycosyltransferase family 9 protein [Chlamydiales bacterium]|nr:glycosyltransferase family 9 protein [Chlamydiales bacterium]
MKKAAVFSHSGLGDAIITLVISNNLHQNGWQVDTYHNGFQAMQAWVPHLPILMYPQVKEIDAILEKYDLIVAVHDDSNEFVLKLIDAGKRKDPEGIKVIYPYPTNGIRLREYYQDSLLDPSKSIIEGYRLFCEEILHLAKTTKENGIIAPLHLKYRKHPKRICLHVASSRPSKNWPIEKFVKLALHLKEKGFDPVIIPGGPKEWKEYEWLVEQGFSVPFFQTLEEAASYLYESGYLIGNDSGLGHLASSMGIPTVTISRRKSNARFWRPNWAPGKIVTPHVLIPNISGWRLRDRKWQSFISVNKVEKAFISLIEDEKK